MSLKPIPRALAFVALFVVFGHVGSVTLLGPSLPGALVGNLLQIFCSFLAAALCFRAAQRSPGFSQSFWTLIGCGFGTWGVANIGWTYYEVILRTEPPPGSLIRFPFDTLGMFFVMAIFLNQEKTDSKVEIKETLDFIQVGILFFVLYFSTYYLPSIGASPQAAVRREMTIAIGGDLAIILLAVLQWRRARFPEVRRLYGGLALYQLVYAIGSHCLNVFQAQQETPTGTWYDLSWSLALLFGAFWAATWQPDSANVPRSNVRKASLTDIVVTNGMFAFLPLAILLLLSELGPEWKWLRYSLLAVSFVCYALRIALVQFGHQQGAETVRRQTLAMDTSSDGMSILDGRGIHVYANTAFAKMLGFDTPERIVGQPWRVVYAFQEISQLENEVRMSLAQSGKWSSHISLKRPSEPPLPVEMSVTLMPDAGTICTCRDLSQREEAERARAEAEAKYRALVEQVNAITYIAEIGINGPWHYVSPQIEAILGYTPEEWLSIAHRWPELIHPDDLPIVTAAEQASEKGEPFQAEYRVKRKDGREVWLNDTGVVVRGSNSRPVMEGIIVDITERKLLETQLQQSRKMEAVGRLAGGIAHDFNNLLTIITGYTDLALSRPAVPLDLRNDIERIENASARAAALVRQLLAFSRKQVLQPKTLDLNAIVVNMDKLLRRLIDDHIEMITCVHDDLGKVRADPAQIEQVIMNLVVNARDAMPEGGRLLLETSNVDLDAAYALEHVSVKPGRYVMLAVSDSGVGMDSAILPHIFEPFYTTKESGRGTGLGLSTVYGIVKQSGGYIWVYSELGKGSTFKVYLPRVGETVEPLESKPKPLAEQRGSEVVLLVEDEEAVRDLIRTILTGQGYEVIVALDPRHAESIASNFPGEIHLLLTDVVMPGTGGRELAARIMSTRPNIRVLYMSGYTENVITSGGMLERGLAFLQKPFSPSALVQKIREVLAHSTSAPDK
ncbi:MAG TPA: PAS domain S-box protein [Candidatus Sulfotelmatobacter sp.]|nr:PAS domain S-box protein [Candidatus Sulfotelmatobacter sp.]